jgi:hypothetical protein
MLRGRIVLGGAYSIDQCTGLRTKRAGLTKDDLRVTLALSADVKVHHARSMRDRHVIAATQIMTESEYAPLCVTFGVTWGKRAYASASSSEDLETERKRVVIGADLDAASRANMGLRGNHPFDERAQGA